MNKFWNWVRNSDESRTLYLNGTIAEESWFDDDITPAAFKAELLAGEGDITVWINSPGGDCVAASQIYSMLMDYKGAVTVKIDGIAASAASVIAMAGTTVLMAPTALMMVHNPLTVAIGDTEEMQKAIAMLDEVKESIINAYEIKTGLSRARLSHLMDAETWLSAHKAVELGFADDLLFTAKEDPAPEPESYAFSRRAVTNRLLNKLPHTKTEQKQPAEPLYQRLNLLNFKEDFTMSMILELREKRAKAWETAKAFLDAKRGADGLLAAEDVATYEKMEADVVNLGKEIDRLERQAALDAELSKPVNTPLTGKPAAPVGEEKTGRASAEYRRSFWNAMRSKMPSHEIMNALQIGTDSEGGYLVPDEFERTLVEALEEQNIFRTLAHVIQTSSGDRKIPVVASKGTASWVDEEGTIPESDDAFSQVSIGAYKLATLVKVSEELLNDSVFDLEAYISREFARRIGNKEEEAFFTGDGTGKPLGVLAATGGAEIGVTAASATAFTADEVFDLFYSLKAPYRKNAVFLMNDSSVKALRKLKDGNGQYLWQPSLTAGTPDMLLGRPVYTSAFMPAMAASAKSILFGDLSYYWVADRQGRSFRRLGELYATTGQVGFLASQRVDGKLILPEAVKVLQQKAA